MPGAMFPQLFRDGIVLPDEDIRAHLRHKGSRGRQIILGSTREEFTLLPPLSTSRAFVQVSDDRERRITVADKNLYYIALEYLARFYKAACVDEVAQALAGKNPDNIYVYRFDWSKLLPLRSADNVRLGATHGLDVPFIFGHLELGPEFFHTTLIDQADMPSFEVLSRAMMSYWAEFARNGEPGSGGSRELPEWRPWRSQILSECLLFDDCNSGGVRMASVSCSTAQVLAELHGDRRFTPGGRAAFLMALQEILQPLSIPTHADTFNTPVPALAISPKLPAAG
jgi:para-nitrobenzyl esterase